MMFYCSFHTLHCMPAYLFIDAFGQNHIEQRTFLSPSLILKGMNLSDKYDPSIFPYCGHGLAQSHS